MKEHFRRRQLPHLDLPGATYFVTACLEGSIPAQGLLDLERFHHQLAKEIRPLHFPEDEWGIRIWKRGFARCDDWLDRALAVRHFEDTRLAELVVQSLYHFAGQRYDLLAYAVMPSHLHWVFRPRDEWVQSLGDAADQRTPRERIMHSLMTFTGLGCNRLLGTHGPFWQSESYDHVVRSSLDLERIIQYVENNPIKAGLVRSSELWPYSSAKVRFSTGVSLGRPLIRAE